MARPFDYIKNLNDSKETWKLGVRVLDVWSVINSKGVEHLEMLIMDSKGDRVQVLVRSDHTPKWKAKIKEDMTCIINNGTVYNNDFAWKLCDHSKKFVFLGGTTVNEIELKDIPPKCYFFKDFSEILKGNCKLERLEDIIGSVHEIVSMQSNAGGKKAVVSVVLKDLNDNLIKCSLWESFASKFLNYYNQNQNCGAIVIILTHAMIKDAQVSNGWNGSKLLINEDIKEIRDFKSNLCETELSQRPTQSSQSMSQWTGGSQYTPQQKFVHNSTCMTLKDISELKKKTICCTVATTSMFAVSKYGWSYYGCTKCTTKATNLNKQYKCTCGEDVKEAIPRYKIEIYVKDGNTKFKFVFWDSDCAAIVGKSALELRQIMLEEGEDDPLVYPTILDDKMLNQKMAFRIKVQPDFGSASVQKFSMDDVFIQHVENELNIDENQSEAVPTKTIKSEENVEFATQSLSACGENDLEISSAITPAKRASNQERVEEVEGELLGSTQFSGTKPFKQVKFESKN